MEYAKTSGGATMSSLKGNGVSQGWSLGTVLELLITTTSNEGSTRQSEKETTSLVGINFPRYIKSL